MPPSKPCMPCRRMHRAPLDGMRAAERLAVVPAMRTIGRLPWLPAARWHEQPPSIHAQPSTHRCPSIAAALPPAVHPAEHGAQPRLGGRSGQGCWAAGRPGALLRGRHRGRGHGWEAGAWGAHPGCCAVCRCTWCSARRHAVAAKQARRGCGGRATNAAAQRQELLRLMVSTQCTQLLKRTPQHGVCLQRGAVVGDGGAVPVGQLVDAAQQVEAHTTVGHLDVRGMGRESRLGKR